MTKRHRADSAATRMIPVPEQIDALGAILGNLDEVLMTDSERAEAVVWAWEGMRGKGIEVRHTSGQGVAATDSCPLCMDEGVLWSSDEQRCWPCSCAASAGEAGTATTVEQGVVNEHAIGAAETPGTHRPNTIRQGEEEI